MKKPIIFLLFTTLFSLSQTLHAQSSTTRQTTLTDKVNVNLDTQALTIPEGYTQNLHWDLPLATSGTNGSTITWKSGNPQYLSNDGKFLKRSPAGGAQVKVAITATVTAGMEKQNKVFTVLIAREEPKYQGYLFSYFEGSGTKELQEQLRFAASADAVNWFALNNNEPIVPSAEISATGGVRDPHILRGEDEKSFYMVATDMFTVKDGWDHNPGIVLMRSNNLTTWTHGIIDLEKSYPHAFPKVKWVWAPQTIYDPAAGKYLVYFTVRLNDSPALDFYAAYANKEFTAFESEPKLLFKAKYGAIDGDIVYKDGLYHFFYKGNTKNEAGKEVDNGIQQATSKSLQGPWVEDYTYVDAYSAKKVSVEGSGIFKLNDGSGYVLMYDLYRDHRYEFQRSKDLFRFSPTPESFTKNFNPRHGTVISITADEARLLSAKWTGVPGELLSAKSPAPRK